MKPSRSDHSDNRLKQLYDELFGHRIFFILIYRLIGHESTGLVWDNGAHATVTVLPVTDLSVPELRVKF